MTTHETQGHVAVLLQEAIDGLNLKNGGVFLDCTLGSAGHSFEVFKRFGSGVRIIALDADPERAEEAKQLLAKSGASAQVFNINFRNLDEALKEAGIQEVNAGLFDLGLNSEQLRSSGKGFSFQNDESLVMTFGEPNPGVLTAYEIVNRYDEASLEEILREYGEERQSKNIARAIVAVRKVSPIRTTFELVEAIRKGYRGKYPRSTHFATRTFQGLRIAVNDEIGALSQGLEKAFEALAPQGRLVVISFHSIEDRVVKQFNRMKADEEKGKLVNKKPIVPTDAECASNPRSRSAKLRILEKI